ncbi:disulfide isomerase-like protein 2-3, partial [Tanacetum coccineum]
AKNLQGKVKLGHVNCDDKKSLMSRYKVEGFPTILVFGTDKESPLTYEGARSASAIESFIMLETNVAPPEVTELTSPGLVTLFVSLKSLIRIIIGRERAFVYAYTHQVQRSDVILKGDQHSNIILGAWVYSHNVIS